MKLRISNTITVAIVSQSCQLVSYAAPKPDLAVQAWAGPTTVLVNSAYQYTARVRNIGNQTAQNVTLMIEFPLTNTSPTQQILGKLTNVPANWVVNQNKRLGKCIELVRQSKTALPNQ